MNLLQVAVFYSWAFFIQAVEYHQCESSLDGECVEDLCSNNHEKCDLWMTKGEVHFHIEQFLVYMFYVNSVTFQASVRRIPYTCSATVGRRVELVT
jgi:hypothetical protein